MPRSVLQLEDRSTHTACIATAAAPDRGNGSWPANRIPLLQNGTIDIECGSTTNNAARQQQVAFAVTTFVEEIRIAVRAESGIQSISQLNGKKVATTTGTTSVQLLRKHQKAAGVEFQEVFGKPANGGSLRHVLR